MDTDTIKLIKKEAENNALSSAKAKNVDDTSVWLDIIERCKELIES